jgi:hypothetical protein
MDSKMLVGSMSDYLRGHEEEKYGGFDQEEEEEGSIRDYRNESSGEEEAGHGLDLMVVGKAIKVVQEPIPRSSLMAAKDTLRDQDGSSDEGSELDLY